MWARSSFFLILSTLTLLISRQICLFTLIVGLGPREMDVIQIINNIHLLILHLPQPLLHLVSLVLLLDLDVLSLVQPRQH